MQHKTLVKKAKWVLKHRKVTKSEKDFLKSFLKYFSANDNIDNKTRNVIVKIVTQSETQQRTRVSCI